MGAKSDAGLAGAGSAWSCIGSREPMHRVHLNWKPAFCPPPELVTGSGLLEREGVRKLGVAQGSAVKKGQL